MRVLTVIGARPQFIKAAPLSAALRRHHEEFLVHTGQHYDSNMSDIFFEELGLPLPDVNLGVGSGTHGAQTAQMLTGLEALMMQQKPDAVLVYGDTNSTLAGALAASKLHIPVVHIEAGLRSFNRLMPEEINRVLTDHVSRLLFCPTPTAVDNLAREGIIKGVVLTGDIMFDAVLMNRERARTHARVHHLLPMLHKEPYALVTIHRPANTDNAQNLSAIVKALNSLEMRVVLPLHPRTRGMLVNTALSFAEHVSVIDPVGALDMIALLESAKVVITDSGGLQKEAYMLKVPCVTVRTETEWVETVASGWNVLAAPEEIVVKVAALLAAVPNEHPPFYGDGKAAEKMVSALDMLQERSTS